MIEVSLKILVVEDNDALREATIGFLQQQGHYVRGVPCAEDVHDLTGSLVPDVYVIDLGLPDEDGLSLTSRIRTSHPRAGIVVTTARTEVNQRVDGYRSGADLYLPKPVHPAELSTAIASLGRRMRIESVPSNALVLEMAKRQLTGPSGTVDLTFGEALVLAAFARSPGQSLERWQLGEIIGHSESEPPTAASIEMRISRLRKRLQEAGAPAPTIKAVHKIGYALCRAVVVD
jgi:DNA-binding response OmpR family regulator